MSASSYLKTAPSSTCLLHVVHCYPWSLWGLFDWWSVKGTLPTLPTFEDNRCYQISSRSIRLKRSECTPTDMNVYIEVCVCNFRKYEQYHKIHFLSNCQKVSDKHYRHSCLLVKFSFITAHYSDDFMQKKDGKLLYDT